MQADMQFLKVTVAKTLATLKGRLLWVLNQIALQPHVQRHAGVRTLSSTPCFTPLVTVDGFIFEHSLPL